MVAGVVSLRYATIAGLVTTVFVVGSCEKKYKGRTAKEWSQQLRSADAEMQESALDAIERLGTAARAALPDLLTAPPPANMNITHVAHRGAAISAVLDPKDTKALDALAFALMAGGSTRVSLGGTSKQTDLTRVLACIALTKLGGSAVPYLVRALKSQIPEAREMAAAVLSEIGPRAKEAIPDLEIALKDPDGDVRETVTKALSVITNGSDGVAFATGARGSGANSAPIATMVGTVHVGEALVRGGLDAPMIKRIVRRHVNDVKLCYEQGLKQKPNLYGRLTIQFTIAAEGNVIASALQDSTTGSPDVEGCILRAVRKWEFPKPVGGGIGVVSFPFSLEPAAKPNADRLTAN